MKKLEDELREITIHELNRIGFILNEEYTLLSKIEETPQKSLFLNIFRNKIIRYNKIIRESKQYVEDHHVKYFIDNEDELHYTAKKKLPIGFL